MSTWQNLCKNQQNIKNFIEVSFGIHEFCKYGWEYDELEIPARYQWIFELLEKQDGKALGLKREMGLVAAINVIIGVMIGSGIFISPQDALKYSGSIGACIVVWIACGIISLLGALCFAELGTVVPRSGAEYAYLIEAFSKTDKFWGPLPSFVCAWVYVSIYEKDVT